MGDECYHPRVIDGYLGSRLASAGALEIRGPKGCGKTATAMRMAASAVSMEDLESGECNVARAWTKPSLLLMGACPRLIDEWQAAPKIWDAVRTAVGRDPGAGYILASSSVPKDSSVKHLGTNRIAKVDMRTMSLFESGESTGEVSLERLFAGETGYDSLSDMTLDDLAFVICRGGWPESADKGRDDALKVAKARYRSIVNSEISQTDGVRRDPETADRIMRALAGSMCSEKTTTAIAEESGVSRLTAASYIEALGRIFVADDIPAWKPELESKARLVASPERCLCDPSLAAAALEMGPESLFRNMRIMRSLFESLAIRDLRVYSQVIGGRVFHYHDTAGSEVDAIVVLEDGRWCAIDVRMGCDADEGARSLLRFRNKTKLADGTGPSFLAVLTGTGFYHVRPDGVLVIPIGCLGP